MHPCSRSCSRNVCDSLVPEEPVLPQALKSPKSEQPLAVDGGLLGRDWAEGEASSHGGQRDGEVAWDCVHCEVCPRSVGLRSGVRHIAL